MKKIISISLLSLLLACNSSEHNNMDHSDTTAKKDTTSNDDNVWITLFDGKTTNGWHCYGNAPVTPAWKVVDGSLHFDATNRTPADSLDIVTDDEFGNFHLMLEWKVAPRGNSGIIFYVHEDKTKYPNTYNTGLEMQVLDNGTATQPGHSDAANPKHRAGDLYDLIAAMENAKPGGEWNLVEIISNNGRLDFHMNGVPVLNTTLWDDNWKQMVANSKFRSMPDWGTFKKGKIALQNHGDNVWYRNIRIRRL